MWLDIAAARGDDRAAPMRDQLAAKMTPDQIAEAQKLALEWHPTGTQIWGSWVFYLGSIMGGALVVFALTATVSRLRNLLVRAR
jgi:hypothetical protein